MSGVSPECLYQSLHFLRFTLHTNMSLKLPQSLIQLHPREIHLIHHTAIKMKEHTEFVRGRV